MEIRDRGRVETDHQDRLPRILRTTRRRTKQSVGRPSLGRGYAGVLRSVRYTRCEDDHRNDEVPQTTGAVPGGNEARGVPPTGKTFFYPASHRNHTGATRSLPTTEACAGALGGRKCRVLKIGGQRNHSPFKEQLVITVACGAKEGRAMAILR